MLLAIDVGNTNTVVGVYEGRVLVDHWRLSTSAARTGDENAVTLRELFRLGDRSPTITAAIISSVVPGTVRPFCEALERHFGVVAVIMGPGIDAGMPIRYDNPHEVGADRIVNGVAAFDRFRAGVIVVDFGTATTFDCVSPQGEYLGGAIAPGLGISADALYHHAAKLPRVEIARPAAVVGRNTVASMQSGLYYGYAGLVDGIVRQMAKEVDFEPRVIATGGLAALIATASETIEEADEMLTLTGLRIIHERMSERSRHGA